MSNVVLVVVVVVVMEHARLMVERPEIKDTQAGFEALGGRCESCGTCTDSCLKKLGLEHEDGSRSPSSISPKSEKMYTFFEKSLSLVSSSPTRFGDHLVPREKRSHSLATPAAMANVVHFQELHSRHAESHLLRTVNMAASNAVLSRISARLKAVTTATQQESVEEVDEEVEAQAAAASPRKTHRHHHHHHHQHNHHHHCHGHGHHSSATTPQDAASSQQKAHGGTTPTTSTTAAAFPSPGSTAQGKVNATASNATGGITPTQAKDGASPTDEAPSSANAGKEEGLKQAENHESKNEGKVGEAEETKEAATEKSTDDAEKASGEVTDSSPHAPQEATPEAQNVDGDESAT
ncbi:hypothetical protein E2C01_048115 [Portunus trituberculatus]|uniref:4Fe-4S ferredoxin-type domain-containing protein n=1 Tax=Portunus trituberculatus TaxID=210409 RepID=A0A5B7G9R0_PORTR|nr:hypothetical protein [Portunus trituberculatus]